MAYEIHIRRGGNSESNSITLSEVQKLCNEDPALEYQDELEAENPSTGQAIRIRGQFCIWRVSKESKPTTFGFWNGALSFRHSDAAMVKAREIARVLNARIYGDEGEEY